MKNKFQTLAAVGFTLMVFSSPASSLSYSSEFDLSDFINTTRQNFLKICEERQIEFPLEVSNRPNDVFSFVSTGGCENYWSILLIQTPLVEERLRAIERVMLDDSENGNSRRITLLRNLDYNIEQRENLLYGKSAFSTPTQETLNQLLFEEACRRSFRKYLSFKTGRIRYRSQSQ